MMPPLESTETDAAIRPLMGSGADGTDSRILADAAGSDAHAEPTLPSDAAPGEIHDSAVGELSAEQVTIHDSLVGSLVADQVQARDSLILVAKAERIEGEGTRVMLTPRSAMLLGAALGLTLLLGRRLLGGRG
ncbi:MAG: hypothetical protein KDH92_01835 [Chloroflexi bacterium]|nr:hypothetical protein [Chloroflexota bacterium]